MVGEATRPGAAAAGGTPVIGVSFDTLQTEYWVASRDAIEAGIKKRGGEMLLAVANNDSNRQFEQVNNFIAKGVDGIVIAPKDAQSVVPIIKAANRARTSRSSSTTGRPAKSAGKCVTVVADNFEITRNTVTYMARQAKQSGRRYKAMILIGDLADMNAVNRRDGFEAAAASTPT